MLLVQQNKKTERERVSYMLSSTANPLPASRLEPNRESFRVLLYVLSFVGDGSSPSKLIFIVVGKGK